MRQRIGRAAGVIAVLALLGLAGLGQPARSGAEDPSPSTSGTIVVEDWGTQPMGHVGVPVGWEKQSWSRGQCDLRIEKLVGPAGVRPVLHMVSDGDNCTISKRVKKIDIREYPILRWRWRAVRLPTGGDARQAGTDDQAAQLYLAFPRFPAAVRSRIIGYVWDSTAPAGGVFTSASTRLVTYVVVRSGPGELDRWITERRNVREDFLRIYGEEPAEQVEAVTIAIDSNDTGSRAESFMGEIVFGRQ